MHLVTTSVVESPPKSRLSKSKDIVLKKKFYYSNMNMFSSFPIIRISFSFYPIVDKVNTFKNALL